MKIVMEGEKKVMIVTRDFMQVVLAIGILWLLEDWALTKWLYIRGLLIVIQNPIVVATTASLTAYRAAILVASLVAILAAISVAS